MSVKVIENVTIRQSAYDFLLTFPNNHGPISYHFRERRRLQSKIAKFFHLHVFCAPAEGVPLELGTGVGDQTTRMMGLPSPRRSLTTSSALWIQCTNVTDRRTDTGRQQRPRLRIASRGKKDRCERDMHRCCVNYSVKQALNLKRFMNVQRS